MMAVRILIGDVRGKLADLADESVHCVVTSPPYFALRDYGVDGQIGLEATPDEYITIMVDVFRKVRRVMRSDATLWLNLGDSYAGSWGAQGHRETPATMSRNQINNHPKRASHTGTIRQKGLKPKDLMMMPSRLALALQADGWWLRSEIVWSKLNPMPESMTDRPTSAHEKVFLLAKSKTYFYDAEAVRESSDPRYGKPHERVRNVGGRTDGLTIGKGGAGFNADASFRNLRNVWNIATQPYPDAHFATFPTALVEPCIRAGTSEKGCCPECGAPWVREVERSPMETRDGPKSAACRAVNKTAPSGTMTKPPESKTIGWVPSCLCYRENLAEDAVELLASIPCTVLDPFAGSGTTGLVADRLNRNAILIELNPDYAAMAKKRLHADAGMFAEVVA